MQSFPSIMHVTCFGGTLSMTWYSRQRFKIKVQSCPVLPPPPLSPRPARIRGRWCPANPRWAVAK